VSVGKSERVQHALINTSCAFEQRRWGANSNLQGSTQHRCGSHSALKEALTWWMGSKPNYGGARVVQFTAILFTSIIEPAHPWPAEVIMSS
jgi:hypothetical protein